METVGYIPDEVKKGDVIPKKKDRDEAGKK